MEEAGAVLVATGVAAVATKAELVPERFKTSIRVIRAGGSTP